LRYITCEDFNSYRLLCFTIMSNFLDIEIQNIDHLGIIAGIIDSIGLVEIINEIIGQEPGEKVSPGQVVKAMILNGLGFVSSPLYPTFRTLTVTHQQNVGKVVHKAYKKK
jgi:Domain of unknown function (DUF4277)